MRDHGGFALTFPAYVPRLLPLGFRSGAISEWLPWRWRPTPFPLAGNRLRRLPANGKGNRGRFGRGSRQL